MSHRGDHIAWEISAGNDLLDFQGLAFEFHRLGVEILQLDHDRRVGGRADLGRIEFLVLVAQLDFGGALRIGSAGGGKREQRGGSEQGCL